MSKRHCYIGEATTSRHADPTRADTANQRPNEHIRNAKTQGYSLHERLLR